MQIMLRFHRLEASSGRKVNDYRAMSALCTQGVGGWCGVFKASNRKGTETESRPTM